MQLPSLPTGRMVAPAMRGNKKRRKIRRFFYPAVKSRSALFGGIVDDVFRCVLHVAGSLLCLAFDLFC
jgi:hypothetical protein